MAIALRAGTVEDRDLIVGFNLAMARETEDHDLDVARLTAGVGRALADPGRGLYTVALDDGQPVGCLMVTREWSDWRDGWIWWIQSVFVSPGARGRGVYRALHDDVLARARESGDVRAVRLYVERENVRAQQVYDACGMSPSKYLLYAQDVEPGAGA